MADNFTTVAPESTAPVGLKVATKEMDDTFSAGITLVVDASGARAKMLAISAAGAAKVDGSAVTQPVSAASLPLPSGAATETTVATLLTQSDYDTRAGSLTETAPGTDTASSGLNGRLQRVAQRITSLIALLPTSLGGNGGLKVEGIAGGTAVPTSLASVPSHPVTNAGTFAVQAALTATEVHAGEVGGRTVTIGVEITRPADTTAYTALDSVNTSTSAPTSITFAGMSRIASGSGYITKARLVTDQSACVAQMRLWLFNAAPNTLNNDNAAFLIKYADKLTCIGYIDFPALTTEAGSDSAQALSADLRLAFTADASSQLLGIYQTRTAFTPTSSQKFYTVLVAEQN